MYVCNACVCVFTHIGAAAHCTTVLLSTGSTGGVRAFTRAWNGGRGEDGRRTGIGKGDTDKVSLPRSYYGTKARKESGGGEGNERRRESYPYTIDIRLRSRFYTRLQRVIRMDGIGALRLNFDCFFMPDGCVYTIVALKRKKGIVDHISNLDDFFITL